MEPSIQKNKGQNIVFFKIKIMNTLENWRKVANLKVKISFRGLSVSIRFLIYVYDKLMKQVQLIPCTLVQWFAKTKEVQLI